MIINSITPPNVAAVIENDGVVTYTDAVGANIITSDTSTFTEYATVDAAYAAAVALDADFDGNNIYGEIAVTPDNPITAYEVGAVIGASVSLDGAHTADDASATVTYQWYKDDIIIAGATNSSVSTTSFAVEMVGIYKCVITAENSSKSTTGANKISYSVVEAPPANTAAFAIGGA